MEERGEDDLSEKRRGTGGGKINKWGCVKGLEIQSGL